MSRLQPPLYVLRGSGCRIILSFLFFPYVPSGEVWLYFIYLYEWGASVPIVDDKCRGSLDMVLVGTHVRGSSFCAWNHNLPLLSIIPTKPPMIIILQALKSSILLISKPSMSSQRIPRRIRPLFITSSLPRPPQADTQRTAPHSIKVTPFSPSRNFDFLFTSRKFDEFPYRKKLRQFQRLLLLSLSPR